MLTAMLLIYCNFRLTSESDCLESYLKAIAAWALLLFGATELLSVFAAVRFVPVLLFWLMTDVFLLAVLFIRCHNKKLSFRECGKRALPSFTLFREKKYIVLFLISLSSVVLALTTVPYNWDSMTYHLSRIVHWVQNGSVAHYATNCIRQIASPVLAEFVNLHVYILTGESDKLFALLQCFSYLTGAVIVFQISHKIKCSNLFCYIAALLYLTMPSAFAEALTTQVDNFATLWLLIFTYLLLDFTDMNKPLDLKRRTISKVCCMGLCVSLGYLTKPSVCIAMAIMVLWLLILCILRKDRFSVILRLVGCVLPGILLPMIPELIRNIHTFGAISAPSVGKRQLVGTLNPLYLLVNLAKNSTYNLPNVYIKNFNAFLLKALRKFSLLLGVVMDDPSISEDGRVFSLHSAPNYGHDTALNPIINWLFFFCLLYALIHFLKKRAPKWYTSYSLVVSVCFIFFCTVLRWEPFVSRYMVSYLTLLCPMIAYQLQQMTSTSRGLRTGIIGAICLLCVIDVVEMGTYHHNLCILYGANETPYGYFVNRSNEYAPYQSICQEIADLGYSQIGLRMEEDNYEYPLWKMLPESSYRLEHVMVSNQSAIYADPSYQPECIIWLGSLSEEEIHYNGQIYRIQLKVDDKHYLLVAE